MLKIASKNLLIFIMGGGGYIVECQAEIKND